MRVPLGIISLSLWPSTVGIFFWCCVVCLPPVLEFQDESDLLELSPFRSTVPKASNAGGPVSRTEGGAGTSDPNLWTFPSLFCHGSFRDMCLWPAPAGSLRPQMAESESRKVSGNSKLPFRVNALQSAQPGPDTSCVALERCVNLSLPWFPQVPLFSGYK